MPHLVSGNWEPALEVPGDVGLIQEPKLMNMKHAGHHEASNDDNNVATHDLVEEMLDKMEQV